MIEHLGEATRWFLEQGWELQTSLGFFDGTPEYKLVKGKEVIRADSSHTSIEKEARKYFESQIRKSEREVILAQSQVDFYKEMSKRFPVEKK